MKELLSRVRDKVENVVILTKREQTQPSGYSPSAPSQPGEDQV